MKEKKHYYLLAKSYIFISILVLFPANVFGMHIMEGYLSPFWCVVWTVLSIPFLFFGYRSIKKKIELSPKSLVMLALCGAFAFVLSSLKMPSITGSSSHPTGLGLGAIMFGPFSMSIISFIILIFQAMLLAHGGITTLGANIFSMGIAGPILAFTTYKLTRKLKLKTEVCVFLAAFIGDLCTYIVTSLQLALAFPDKGNILDSFIKFAGVFAITQVPLAICEGLLTVIIFGILEKYGELDFMKKSL